MKGIGAFLVASAVVVTIGGCRQHKTTEGPSEAMTCVSVAENGTGEIIAVKVNTSPPYSAEAVAECVKTAYGTNKRLAAEYYVFTDTKHKCDSGGTCQSCTLLGHGICAWP